MANELRWILLGLGALFLVGLALWELRRPRHAARKAGQLDPVEPAAWQAVQPFGADDGRPLEMPDIRGADLRRDPPIVMIEDVSLSGPDEGLQVAAEVAVDRPSAAQLPDEVTEPLPAPPASAAGAPAVIRWPPERQDRILWFRVVAGEGPRFGGRAMRQALNGCGLVHGPQDIFHWVDESGQVIASAANLLRPGSFDLATMDAQDFPGLHLFSVLPGPLDPLHAFDELLGLARDLATRLNGLVQDERGRTVDAQAVEALRQALADALAGKGPAA